MRSGKTSILKCFAFTNWSRPFRFITGLWPHPSSQPRGSDRRKSLLMVGSSLALLDSKSGTSAVVREPTDPKSTPSSLVGSVTLVQPGLESLSTGSCSLWEPVCDAFVNPVTDYWSQYLMNDLAHEINCAHDQLTVIFWWQFLGSFAFAGLPSPLLVIATAMGAIPEALLFLGVALVKV